MAEQDVYVEDIEVLKINNKILDKYVKIYVEHNEIILKIKLERRVGYISILNISYKK